MNNTQTISKKRINLWDNIKFLLITLVVIGHFVDINGLTNNYNSFKSIFIFIYAFHMPLFIFISGLFYKPKNITNKFLMYIIIGFALKITMFITNYILGNNPSFSLLSDKEIPWFMFSLATFTVVCYFLRNQNKKLILIFSIILACFVGYDKEIGDFLYLSRSIVFFPFFWIGTMIKSEDIIKIKEKYNKKLFIIGSIIILIWGISCLMNLDILYTLRHLFTGKNHFSQAIYNFGPLARLFCYVVATTLSIAIIAVVPNKKIHIITDLGQKTLQIFFWHYPILYILVAVFNLNAFCSSISGKIVFLELAVLTTFILTHRIFSFPTKQIIKYTKK